MLEIKQALLDDTRVLFELANTLYPWSSEIFSMEYANLMEHLKVANIWTQSEVKENNDGQ